MDEAYINKYFVGVQGDSVVTMRSTTRMTKKDALIYAAWIVAMVDIHNEFPAILAAIQEG